MQQLLVRYGNVTGIASVEATLTRGVTPSRFILRIAPQENLSPAPATLTISDGTNTVQFPDMVPQLHSLRREVGEDKARWSLPLLDRRWKWAGPRVSARFNLRLPNCKIREGYKKNAREIAQFLMDGLGEANADVGAVPNGCYPTFNWEGRPATLALKDLCDAVNCVPCLTTANRIVIVRRGVGPGLPEGPRVNAPWKFTPPVPQKLVLAGGPSWWQTLLKLRPVTHESDGDLAALATADYWAADEFPMFFPNIGQDERHLASRDAYRLWQAYQQSNGGLNIGSCPEPINDIRQIYPIYSHRLDIGAQSTHGDEVELAATLRGTYWPWCDHPYNTSEGTECPVDMQVIGRDGLLRTEVPIIEWDGGETPAAPDLYCLCAYNVRKFDTAELLRMTRERNLGGPAGAVTIYRPELFESRAHQYSGLNETGVDNNLADVNQEADAYLDAFQPRYQNPEQMDMQYAGILPIDPGGRIEQVRWMVKMGHGGTTRASAMHEFDVFTPSEKERNALAEEAAR